MKKLALPFLALLLVFINSCAPAPAPAPTEEQVTWSVPSPTGNTAVVYGEIHSSTDTPVGDMVFLSENLTVDNPELPPTISFSYQYSPRAIVDTDRGYFYFENVEPGLNYVVTVMTGSGEFVFVTQEDGKTPLLVSVEAGDSIELGELLVEMPDLN